MNPAPALDDYRPAWVEPKPRMSFRRQIAVVLVMSPLLSVIVPLISPFTVGR